MGRYRVGTAELIASMLPLEGQQDHPRRGGKRLREGGRSRRYSLATRCKRPLIEKYVHSVLSIVIGLELTFTCCPLSTCRELLSQLFHCVSLRFVLFSSFLLSFGLENRATYVSFDSWVCSPPPPLVTYSHPPSRIHASPWRPLFTATPLTSS